MPVSGICIVFQLWSEQEGSLYGSPVVLEMGLHTAFTTVWTPTVSLAVRWENNRPGSSQRDTEGRETSLSFRTFLQVSTVMTTHSSTCLLEYPQAKDPVKCQGKKKLQLSAHRLPVSDLYFWSYFMVCKDFFLQEAVVLLPWVRPLRWVDDFLEVFTLHVLLSCM